MRVAGAKVLLFANTDWYLFNFRRSLALALRDAGYELLLISPPGPYGAKLRALGLRWEPLSMDRRSLNPLRELLLLWRLLRLMRRERPALVHGFTIKCAVYSSLVARLVGVPGRVNAVTGMGYVFTSDDLKASLLRPLVRVLFRLALGGKRSRVIVQNPDDHALFRNARLLPDGYLRVIRGSGVDCVRFSPLPLRTQPGGTLTILMVARLLWDKGIAEFVQAARILKAASGAPALRFILAGDPDPGNPASVPEATVKQWQAQGLIEWLGHVSDMPGLFRAADIVVLPSYREGLPKTLIEAGACGLPLVTTDVPGCREVVTHEMEGLLVPARNAEALAAAIARLRDDPRLASRLGAAARQKVLAHFDERIVVERTLDVYRELLERS